MVHRIALAGVLALCIVGLPVLAAERPVPTAAAVEEVPRLAPDTAQRLRTAIPRATLVNALLANPTTKALVLDVATKAKIPAARINTLAAKPLPVQAIKPLFPMPGAAEYAKIDWSAGIFFHPFFPPKYSTNLYNLGEYTIQLASFKTADNGVIDFTPNPSTSANMKIIYSIISLSVELPTGPGTYMVALNLTDYQGSSPAAWIGGEPQLDAILYSGGHRFPVALTTLAGQPGFVGIVSADLQDQHLTQGSKMRACSANLEVRFTMLPGQPRNLLHFGGITLTRL